MGIQAIPARRRELLLLSNSNTIRDGGDVDMTRKVVMDTRAACNLIVLSFILCFLHPPNFSVPFFPSSTFLHLQAIHPLLLMCYMYNN